jgi:hypothetical protein
MEGLTGSFSQARSSGALSESGNRTHLSIQELVSTFFYVGQEGNVNTKDVDVNEEAYERHSPLLVVGSRTRPRHALLGEDRTRQTANAKSRLFTC